MDIVLIPSHLITDRIRKLLKDRKIIIIEKDKLPEEIRETTLENKPHSVFIIGKHEDIPFFQIKNPVRGDGDNIVYTDNPYASLDDDYIIPEIPVGRLPFDKEEEIIKYLEKRQFIKKNNLIKGYSAEIWKMASLNVEGHMDMNADMELCPPMDASKYTAEMSKYSYLYYNLHGSSKSPYWFGQSEDGADYPVAVATYSIKEGEGSIISSEACYGAYIINKDINSALSLNFLSKGAAIFVGSTMIAYGPYYPPAAQADLLVMLFMLYSVKKGITGGQAFTDAKKMYARHNIWINGYLDDDDKKTLLEFVYYGDPLIITGV